MLNIDDYIQLAEAVADEIGALPVMATFKGLQQKIATDDLLKGLVRDFERAKEHHEEAQRFGDYYPGKDEVRARLIAAKSALFANPDIKAFKACEKQIQQILDQLSRAMDDVVSFDSGKSGGCCSGGSCSCNS
ncbi:MAG: YlbF family regulator [Turicibacter sp.]|nr:YlbF family regulator [Turicibacter sp.]